MAFDTMPLHDMHIWIGVESDGTENALVADHRMSDGRDHSMTLMNPTKAGAERLRPVAERIQSELHAIGRHIRIELRHYRWVDAPRPS